MDATTGLEAMEEDDSLPYREHDLSDFSENEERWVKAFRDGAE